MKSAKFSLFILALTASFSVFAQEVIPVEPSTKSFFASSPTMTMLYARPDAEATIVVVLGGDGHTNLKPGDAFINQQTARMMRDLVWRSKIKSNIVIIDNPFPIIGIIDRGSTDHLKRLEDVVRQYKESLKTPVWLFGHSNGSISVSEFLNRSPENRNLISGAILSGGRDEVRIGANWGKPILVMHHTKDECQYTTFYGAKRSFKKIQARNSFPTEFASVTGGYSMSDPCSTGLHMYEGAFDEALRIIEDFIYRYSGKCFTQGMTESLCAPTQTAADPPALTEIADEPEKNSEILTEFK